MEEGLLTNGILALLGKNGKSLANSVTHQAPTLALKNGFVFGADERNGRTFVKVVGTYGHHVQN